VEEELEEPLLAEGWVADEVREEFPDLRLRTMAVARGSGNERFAREWERFLTEVQDLV